MPPVRALSPQATRNLLEANGYKLVGENEFAWAFASRVDEVPLMLPRKVDLIPMEIAFHVMTKVGFDLYAEAIAAAGEPFAANE